MLAFCWQHCWANVGKLCWANVILLIGPQLAQHVGSLLAQHQYANKVNYLPTICQQCQLFANSLPTSSSFKIMLDQCWSNSSMPTMASVCQTCFSCISCYVLRNIYLQYIMYFILAGQSRLSCGECDITLVSNEQLSSVDWFNNLQKLYLNFICFFGLVLSIFCLCIKLFNH